MVRAHLAYGDGRLPKQVMHWDMDTTKQKPGRPKKIWINTIRQDLKETGMSWEEALEHFV